MELNEIHFHGADDKNIINESQIKPSRGENEENTVLSQPCRYTLTY